MTDTTNITDDNTDYIDEEIIFKVQSDSSGESVLIYNEGREYFLETGNSFKLNPLSKRFAVGGIVKGEEGENYIRIDRFLPEGYPADW